EVGDGRGLGVDQVVGGVEAGDTVGDRGELLVHGGPSTSRRCCRRRSTSTTATRTRRSSATTGNGQWKTAPASRAGPDCSGSTIGSTAIALGVVCAEGSGAEVAGAVRSEEHTSELQSR